MVYAVLRDLCYLARFTLLDLYGTVVVVLFVLALGSLLDLRGLERLLAIPCALLTWQLGSWVPTAGHALKIW